MMYTAPKVFLYALCVAMVLTIVGCGLEQEQSTTAPLAEDFTEVWASGLSPAAPFEGAEARDLTTHIGYIRPFPNDVLVARGMDQLEVILPRTDVRSGQGALTLYRESDDSVVQRIAFDSQQVRFASLQEQELTDMGWESGTKIYITLDKALEAGSYYVEMEQGCITAPAFDVASPAYVGVWSFEVAEYGIASTEYSSGDIYHARVGDTAVLDIALADEIIASRLEFSPAKIAEATVTELSESGSYHITFKQPGEVMYSIFFLDAQSKEVAILDHTVTVTE